MYFLDENNFRLWRRSIDSWKVRRFLLHLVVASFKWSRSRATTRISSFLRYIIDRLSVSSSSILHLPICLVSVLEILLLELCINFLFENKEFEFFCFFLLREKKTGYCILKLFKQRQNYLFVVVVIYSLHFVY